MYEKLDAIAPLLQNLSTTLASSDAPGHVAQITAALDDSARKVSDATQRAAHAEDRAALQQIYQGLLAARRIVLQLQEFFPA